MLLLERNFKSTWHADKIFYVSDGSPFNNQIINFPIGWKIFDGFLKLTKFSKYQMVRAPSLYVCFVWGGKFRENYRKKPPP